jgi:hypothetical protein
LHYKLVCFFISKKNMGEINKHPYILKPRCLVLGQVLQSFFICKNPLKVQRNLFSLIAIQNFQSQFYLATCCNSKSPNITTTSRWKLFHLLSLDTICSNLPLIKLMWKLLRSFFFFFFFCLTIIRWNLQMKSVKLANNIMDVQQIQQYVISITRIHTMGCK